MLHLAHRNLFQSRTKALLAIGGVALAFMLIFSLDAVLAGLEGRIAGFIEKTGADVWVAQSGVRNMHMASSTIPRAVVDQVRGIDGVVEAAPVRYFTNVMVKDGKQYLAYIIGLPGGATMGTPTRIASGDAYPRPGEVVVDGARRHEGAQRGSRVRCVATASRRDGRGRGTAARRPCALAHAAHRHARRVRLTCSRCEGPSAPHDATCARTRPKPTA